MAMDADTNEMLRRSLAQFLVEEPETPLAERLEALGWAEVVADDAASAYAALFETKGDTLAAGDALGLLMGSLIGAEVGDDSLASAVVALTNPTPSGMVVLSRAPAADDRILAGGLNGEVVMVPSDRARTRAFSTEAFDPDSGPVTAELDLAGASTVADTPGGWSAAVAAGRWATAFELVGVGARVVADAVQYTGERVQYGVAIGSFQALQHRLADAHSGVVGARNLAREASHDRDPWTALVAKAAAGRAAEFACTQAQQAYGAIGFTWEHDFHRHLRRAYMLDRLLGDHRSLEDEIGRELQRRRAIPRVGGL